MFNRNKRLLNPVYFLITCIIVMVCCMVIYPADVYEASKAGVSAWWNIVFPALLPFFISSEILMSYGVIQFMGVIMEPVMRPLFNLPGAASFVMTVGYTSGFPISASLSARLRRENICTRQEAERLMCFTNNSSPLFMLVAVGVGMLKNPRLGIIIAVCHYAANLIIGLVLRFYKKEEHMAPSTAVSLTGVFTRAVAEMRNAWRANPRPLGKVIGDAVAGSINKLLVIGGFVIVFSVIIRVAFLTGIMAVLKYFLTLMIAPLGFSAGIIDALCAGFFEITLGTKAVSEAVAPLGQKLAATGLILGWSGISVLAQVSAMISESDLKMRLFIICRLCQAVLAGSIGYFLTGLEVIQGWLAKPAASNWFAVQDDMSFGVTIFYSCRLCVFVMTVWAIAAAIVYICRQLRIVRLKI